MKGLCCLTVLEIAIGSITNDALGASRRPLANHHYANAGHRGAITGDGSPAGLSGGSGGVQPADAQVPSPAMPMGAALHGSLPLSAAGRGAASRGRAMQGLRGIAMRRSISPTSHRSAVTSTVSASARKAAAKEASSIPRSRLRESQRNGLMLAIFDKNTRKSAALLHFREPLRSRNALRLRFWHGA